MRPQHQNGMSMLSKSKTDTTFFAILIKALYIPTEGSYSCGTGVGGSMSVVEETTGGSTAWIDWNRKLK